MEYRPPPGRKFYCCPTEGQVEGPFELVELAGLLLAGHITGETLMVPEGEEEWLPFQDRTEYNLAKEIPQSAITQHVNETAGPQKSSLSSRKLILVALVMLPLLYLVYHFGTMYLSHHALPGADALDSSQSS